MSKTELDPALLLTVPQAAERWPAFSQSALRSLIFDAPRNGLDQVGAILRLGRRVYVDADRFGEWIAGQQNSRGVR